MIHFRRLGDHGSLCTEEPPCASQLPPPCTGGGPRPRDERPLLTGGVIRTWSDLLAQEVTPDRPIRGGQVLSETRMIVAVRYEPCGRVGWLDPRDAVVART